MVFSVNTNILSTGTQHQLSRTTSSLEATITSLGSGKRINGVKDDVAGSAVARSLNVERAGLSVAQRNVSDGASVLQTAENAINEIDSNLSRLKELALQSANGNYTDIQRSNLQIEVTNIREQINAIASNTSLNGTKLLDGSFDGVDFQIGTKRGNAVSVSIDSVKATDLGSTSTSQAGSFKLAKSTGTDVTSVETANNIESLGAGDLVINGTSIRASHSADDLLSTAGNAASSLAVAAAINAAQHETGVTAAIESNVLTLAVGTGTASVSINGQTAVTFDTASLGTTRTAINAQSNQTGVVASGTTTLILTAADGRNIELENTAAAAGTFMFSGNDIFATAGDRVKEGQVTLYSNEDIVISGNSPSVSGFTAQTIVANAEEILQPTATAFDSLSTGDLAINGYSVDFSVTFTGNSDVDDGDSAETIANAINQTAGLKDEVTATAYTEMDLGAIAAGDIGGFVFEINGEAVTIAANRTVKAGDSDLFLISEINTVLNGSTGNGNGIISFVEDNHLKLRASDGRNIDFNVTTASSDSILGNVNTTTNTTDVVAKGSISVAAKTGFNLEGITGAKKALAGIADNSGSVDGVDISTKNGALNAIETVDTALITISNTLSDIGATQRRLESESSLLDAQQVSTSATQSRIEDANFAQLAADLTRNQILQQLGGQALTLANSQPQFLLGLLG